MQSESTKENKTIELVNTRFYFPEGATREIWLTLIALLLFMFVGYSLILGWGNVIEMLNPSQLMSAYVKQWRSTPVGFVLHTLIIVLIVIYITVIMPMTGRQRIIVRDTGMAFRSNLPSWIQWITPDWEIGWREIESVELVKYMIFPNMPPITKIHTREKNRKIDPAAWQTIEAATKPKKLFKQKLNRSADALIKEMMESVIVRRIQHTGIKIDQISAGKESVLAFALDKNRYTLAVTVIYVVLGLYIVIDGVLLSESYPSVPGIYELNWSLICLAAILVMSIWLRSRKVPRGVCAGLGVVLFFILFPALYIGTLRINMLTDTHGLQTYYYYARIDSGFKLVPEEPALPEITYFDNSPFWHQYLSGDPIKIELRRGGLGIWQFDVEKVLELMRDYNETERKKRKAIKVNASTGISE